MEKGKTPQNSNDHNEIGIIELLNYFRDIFKSILNYIKQFALSVWDLLVALILMIRKNWIFVGASIIVFLGLYFVVTSTPALAVYNYEMIVEPNYKTTNALQERVNSLNFRKESAEYKLTQKLHKIEMKPIEKYQDVVNDYYYATSGEYDDNVAYKTAFPNDTVFFRQIPLEDFEKKLGPSDYSRFRISIKSGQSLDEKDILEAVTDPINKDPEYGRVKTEFLDQLKEDMRNNEISLKVLDTVLLNRSQLMVDGNQDINIDGSAQRVAEREMMREKRDILKDNYSLKLRWIRNQNVINIISNPLLVAPDSIIKRNPYYFMFYGFCFALLVLLFIRFNTYLNKKEKAAS